jgi:hypothetical protein
VLAAALGATNDMLLAGCTTSLVRAWPQPTTTTSWRRQQRWQLFCACLLVLFGRGQARTVVDTIMHQSAAVKAVKG